MTRFLIEWSGLVITTALIAAGLAIVWSAFPIDRILP